MPLLGSLGNAAEVAYGPPSDYFSDPVTFINQFEIDPIRDGQFNPTVVYSNVVQITGVNTKGGLGVDVFAVEKVTTPEFILDPNYVNIAYAISPVPVDPLDPLDLATLNFTNQPGTIKRDEYLVLRLILEPTDPPTNPASFDKTDLFFNDYNPRFSQTIIPDSANETGFNLTYDVRIDIGQGVFQWIVTTRTRDSFPLNFSFTGQEVNPPINNAGIPTVVGSATSINTVVYSENTATILGLEPGYKFLLKVKPESFAGISVDEKVAVASTEVSNGDIVYLKSLTASEYSSSGITTAGIGDTETQWVISTEAENLNITFTPDFTDVLGSHLDVFSESNEIALTGFSPESDLLATIVSSGNTGYYQVEREVVGIGTTVVKSYEDNDIEVQQGDIIKLRMQASSEYSTTETTTFTVGNTSADWSITTRSEST